MVKMRRSVFTKSPTNTLTFKMGYCVPIFCFETLPGDTWKFNVADALRMLPMLAPQFTDISVSVMAFKVPLRTIWKDFDKFRTGGKDNQDTTVAPYMLFSHDAGNVGFSTLSDYLGISPLTFYTKDGDGVYQPNSQVVKASALPFRAYNKIWNEWLRLEHIQDEVVWSDGNGLDTTTPTDLLHRRWNRDYFTQGLPDQQLGLQAYLPISLTGAVVGDGKSLGLTDGTNNAGLSVYNGTYYTTANKDMYDKDVATSVTAPLNGLTGGQAIGVTTDPEKSGLKLDGSDSSASVSWPAVRTTEKMQQLGERLMLGGARMPEFLLSMFGVRSSDARLDISEYLGGFSSEVHVSPIMQTSSTDKTSPQGNQAAIAYHVNGTPVFKTFCEEDGFIMVIASVRPRTAYCQGLHKKFQRWTRYDYANPMFAHLSLEPIKNSELYLEGITNGTDASNWDDPTLDDNKTFAFKPMYQEYRSFPNEIHGDFLNTRQYWHMARIFDTRPELNSDFVECDPTRRPFALTDEQIAGYNTSVGDVIMSQFQIGFTLKRCLPKVGTPRY